MFQEDYLTHAGAHKLKKTLEAYYEKRGLFPDFKVIQQLLGKTKDEERLLYVVRSNINFDAKGYPIVGAKI